MKEIQDFDSLMIKLASPEQIRAWSYGEVKKPETINYRTLRPEKDGLFCERIFGTTKDGNATAGSSSPSATRALSATAAVSKSPTSRYGGNGWAISSWPLRCPTSGTTDRFPHGWGLLLDLSIAALRSILYYEKYVVIEPGDTELKMMQLLTEEEYARPGNALE